MKIFVVLFFVTFVAADLVSFLRWMKENHKTYSTKEEFEIRFDNYENNMNISAQMNKLHNGSATFGETIFSDLSQTEFKDLYLMKTNGTKTSRIPPGFATRASTPPPPRNITHLGFPEGINPVTWDWRDAGVVTGIYNQGQCGSCWAFCATESIESNSAIAGLPLRNYAMQEFVSCDTQSDGCNGGNIETAFVYAYEAGGMNTLQNYPYVAYDAPCQFPQGPVYAQPLHYNVLYGEETMYNWMPQGTLSIGVYAEPNVWQLYRSGIVDYCYAGESDHAVQVTGYSNWNTGEAAWTIRNTWGTNWGENGYIQIRAGYNLCGIGNWVSIVDQFAT
eukprot:TRINITY_DN5663_c0_g1_i1.p1 TRINITY_DN5663_c0_g1~~TRINITY_DN5663_c0_g1_i1.p1  ORF type:complete len:333 (-),score=56.39 TRINITY_DN5663_c0_g1_i1:27-1025(-)